MTISYKPYVALLLYYFFAILPVWADPPASIVRLQFDKDRVEAAIVYQGSILSGARWTDVKGENTLIVSQLIPGDAKLGTHEDIVQELFAYQYVKTPAGNITLLWHFHDWAENACDRGDGLISPIDVTDLDSDGMAETRFMYNVQGGCDLSPRVHKLVMHSGETPYLIQGTDSIRMRNEERPEARSCKVYGEEKQFDAAFKKTPAIFRHEAANFWDHFIPKKNWCHD